jgi:hypothetical protein
VKVTLFFPIGQGDLENVPAKLGDCHRFSQLPIFMCPPGDADHQNMK